MINLSNNQGYALRSRNRSLSPKLLLIALMMACLVAAHGSATAHANPVPVAAYSFDEGSGSTTKDSAGNHDGTVSGATWAEVGKYGSALNFDGVDDLVSIADAADLDLTSAFTLEAWVQPNTITAGRPVIAKSESTGGNSGYLLSARYTGNPTGFVASSGTAKGVARPSPLPEDAWSHLAFTSDGTNLRLYVDGKLAVTPTAAIAAKATAANLVIGYGQVLGGYFHGMIDEVRIYAETLSESEIQVDRDTAIGLDQIPVAAYSFDEGSGTTLGDSVGDHDGTISGATWTAGKYGSALDFDGVDDLVSIANAADLDLTSTFTLQAWVRPDSTTDWSPVIAKNENPESGYGSGYVLFSQGPGKPRGWLSNAGTTKAVTGSSALPTKEWSHLTYTSDGTNLRLYVNGYLVGGPSSASAAGTTGSALAIGHWAYLNKWFDGLIDEVRIYDETLSETQIQTDRDNRIQPPSPSEVTTSVLDTGPSSEKVSSVPITAGGAETVVYSLPVPSLKTDEILRATGNLEVTNTHTYDVTDSVRLVLGSDASDAAGTIVTPWTSFQHTKNILHWTLPINGLYHASSNLGSSQYLKVVFKASSSSAKSGETLTVQPNFGRLAATRYTPAVGPMSQPTHQLQALTDQMMERTTSIPVDQGWRIVLSRKVSELSVEDIIDLTGQLELQNSSGTTVTLESKVTMTGVPCACGSTAAPVTTQRVTTAMTPSRFVYANQFRVTDPSKQYFNLLVRAIPEGGSPQPILVTSGSASLTLLRLDEGDGTPGAQLGQGTLQDYYADAYPDVASIPFAPPGGGEKRVVASAPIYGGLRKGEVIQARGLVTGDLNGGDTAQILTQLILADSPTDVTGQTVASLSGDKVPTEGQVHTSVKEGTYVVPAAVAATQYLNFVVYVSRTPAYEGESMGVPAGSVSFTRAKRTAPLSENFEEGLDSLFKYEWDGTAESSTTVSREGSQSLHIDLDFSNNYEEDPEGVRRIEVRPPDLRAAGGYEGQDSWYGFSVYFPESFKVTHPDDPETTSGRHNTFTQFRTTGSGLDCSAVTAPPIGFTARYWKAGGHTNPGANETATPVDGEYLELTFNGGELTGDCSDTVHSGEKFVLGLVERGQWYDFVIHTTWTTATGSEGNSTSEVWVDGEQVVGNETNPVTTPNLYWHGLPEINSSDGYPQFGLYRGETEEDPMSELYIDAVRSGDTYADVVPGP